MLPVIRTNDSDDVGASSGHNLYHLQAKISNSLVKDEWTEEPFLPRRSLFKLINEGSTRAVVPGISSESVKFICTQAIKVFTLIVTCNVAVNRVRSVIEAFQEHNFTDRALPVTENIQKNCKIFGADGCSHDGTLDVFHSPPWTVDSVVKFTKLQWMLLAPVFEKKKFSDELHGSCPLPFTSFSVLERAGAKAHGALAEMYKVEIHKDHQDMVPWVDGKRLIFALKEILDPADEEKAFTEIRAFSPPTQNSPIVYFTKRHKIYFLFPWAEGSNTLEALWREYPRPEVDGKLVKKVLEQLILLTGAFLALNDWDGLDLSPITVIRIENSTAVGNLQLFDNRTSRYFIYRPTTGREQTVRPQWAHSSSHQVWSLGCISLGFIIWIMPDFDTVKFISETKWQNNPRSMYRLSRNELHGDVKPWMEMLSNHPKCSNSTVPGQLLRSIDENLINTTQTLDNDLREGVEKFRQELAILLAKVGEDGYSTKEAVPQSKWSTGPTSASTPGEGSLKSQQARPWNWRLHLLRQKHKNKE